jgi:beta-catenin-like protein 1
MASEVELYEEVKKLQAIATAPELYPQLIKTKSHLSLVALLNHENTDIVVDVIDLFKELVDEDVLSENPENVTALISSLVRVALLLYWSDSPCRSYRPLRCLAR